MNAEKLEALLQERIEFLNEMMEKNYGAGANSIAECLRNEREGVKYALLMLKHHD